MRPARQALSLLEILFTLGLLTVILVAFASVYPSAYRLNRKSARSTVGAKTSTAVANELLALPIQDTSFNGGNANLLALGSDRAALTAFVRNRLRTAIPPGYTVRPEGVQVTLYGNDLTRSQSLMVQVQVTCYWTDSQSPGLEKSVTVVAGKANNRDAR